MSAFKLFGVITVNNKEAIRAIQQAGKVADNMAASMGKAFTKVGKLAVDCGKVMVKGLAVGGAAMTGLVVKGMGLAGELEQNMGGAEAVFQEFADTMKKTAAEAYHTMGLSQSDYLATANKMGSLFKGAGFGAEEAADMTAEAMERAADVASIMGLDIGAAMESIAGAAKGNFTMMDNLGVAMNDTTLNAYAMEKGLKKTTAQMTNQEKIGLAMKMFLEKTADYAGNYAKENDTLAGSLTTAKAAFQDFLSGAGDADTLTEALLNAGDAIIRKADKLVPKLAEGIGKLIKNLTPKLPGLIQSALPGIIDGAVSLLSGLAQALPGVWSRIVWPAVQKVMKFTLGIELPKWHKIKLELKKRWDDSGIGDWIDEKIKNIGSFMKDAFEWIMDNGETIKIALLAVGAGMIAVKAALNPTKLALDALIAIIATVILNWDAVKEAVGNAIESVGNFFSQTIPQAWKDMCSAIGGWWHDHITAPIQEAIDKLEEFLGLEGTEGDYVPGITGTGGNSAGLARSQFQGKGNKQNPGGNSVERSNYVGGYASGLDFVPYDNFPAYLHYGETVLTRKDADAWRKGSTGNMALLSAKFDQMQETFTQVLEGIRNQPVAINVDSKAVAVLMAREMTKSIGNRNIQSLMAMGG